MSFFIIVEKTLERRQVCLAQAQVIFVAFILLPISIGGRRGRWWTHSIGGLLANSGRKEAKKRKNKRCSFNSWSSSSPDDDDNYNII